MTNAAACGDQERLVAYLYGEGDPQEREQMAAHVAVCPECAGALDEFRAVRGALAAWAPPASALGFRIVQDDAPPAAAPARGGAWRAWGLAAAATLVVAAGAAIANVEIRYDDDGLVVRTGWQRPAEVAAAPPAVDANWRADLEALERRLRTEFVAASRPAVVAPERTAGQLEAELLGRVRLLLQESEKKQQRELAMRVVQLVGEFDTQRRTDLLRIEQGLGRLEGLTGAEVARQRELLNYLVRVSQRR